MLSGFDGSPRSLRGVSELWHPGTNILHRWLQRDYLLMGRDFPRFGRWLEAGREIAKRHDRAFDLNMLRQVLTLALCDKFDLIRKNASYTVIGDGYAALGSILREVVPAHVALVNIGPVLEIDRLYFQRAHPGIEALFIEAGGELPPSLLAFNIASMQEMNPETVTEYFRQLRNKSEYFYCCNRLQKRLPDGTISDFTLYPWADAQVIVDGACEWHQNYYRVLPPKKGLPFDGRHHHRLVRF